MDNLAAMPPMDAISMNNMVPYTWGVAVRRGYKNHSVGLPSLVRSLASWSGATAQALIAWAGGAMYDVTLEGPVSVAPLVTGLNSALWYHVNYATSGGFYLYAVSEGDDDPIVFDGTTVQRLIAGDGVTAWTINGVDPAEFVHITSHNRRLWFVQKGSAIAWYLPTDSLYGTAAPFDLGPIFKNGGTLVAVANWTVDMGEGSNDHLVFFSSEGDVAVYAGINVDDAATWGLKGLYKLGKPAPGRRFFTKLGGDLMILTDVGVVSLATVVTSTQVNASANDTYSKKIQFLISELVSNPPTQDDWQVHYSPGSNFLMINVPAVFEGGSGQLVANQVNQSWCSFGGFDACVWHEYDGNPFFGSHDGRVLRGLHEFQDNLPYQDQVDPTPQPIRWRSQQAYNYFDAPALQKQIGMYRINFLVGLPISYDSRFFYDFVPATVTFPEQIPPSKFGVWAEGIWGLDLWGGGVTPQKRWDQSVGIGVSASLRVVGLSNDEVTWVSTDLSYLVGGIL
jgi:hypothetical protein